MPVNIVNESLRSKVCHSSLENLFSFRFLFFLRVPVFFLAVPPRSMAITSDLDPGKEVTKFAGPYPEGAEVRLSCQVIGGEF